MGNTFRIKLVVLSVLFLINCLFVYGFTQPAPNLKKPPLAEYFKSIDGYRTVSIEGLLDAHQRMLKLDDYLFSTYRGKNGLATLYIGYYYSAGTAYAAHSPLVCYPSQGWKIDTRPITGALEVGPHKIHYEEIVTSHYDKKELVLYWYQARLFTNTQEYKNKISMGYNKLFFNDEEHAFVRVSLPLENRDRRQVKAYAIDFIKDFYPRFEEFIKSNIQETKS